MIIRDFIAALNRLADALSVQCQLEEARVERHRQDRILADEARRRDQEALDRQLESAAVQNRLLAEVSAQNERNLQAAEAWRAVEREHMKECAKRYLAMLEQGQPQDEPVRH